MKIFSKNYQPLISEKYYVEFSEFSLQEVKVPDINEYIGTIYLFVNNINNKVYVGQTITKFYSRFGKHFVDAFNKQDYLIFHKALRKYGWNNFSKYILYQTEVYPYSDESKEKLKNILDEKEIEFITYYNSNDLEYGYNLTKGGTIVPDSAYSQEAIEKAKKSLKLNNFMKGKTYEKHHLAVPILQYNLEKNFLKEWPCIKLAEDTLHISINPSNITCGGYFWLYKKDNIEENLNKKYKQYLAAKEYIHSNKLICCFDLFGELVEIFNSVGNAAKFVGTSSSTISAAARNRTVSCGYIWIFQEDLPNRHEIIKEILEKSKIIKGKFKPIYQIYINGDFIKFWNNLEEIKQNYPETVSIKKCLNNTMQFYRNCFWIYEDDFSDDLLIEKINNLPKNDLKRIEEAQNIKNFDTKHDTSKNKEFLKNNPIIYQYSKEKQLIKIWNSYKDIEKETEYKFANISKCLRHKMHTAYGYIWRFKDDNNFD